MSDPLVVIGMPGPLCISVRVVWLPDPGGHGALRVADGAWWCRRCLALAYDHEDIDAVLEAPRLGVESTPCVSATSCGRCRG